jgi:hypothetical protein
MNLNTARSWIAAGKRKEALEWLLTQPEHPDVLLLKAVCMDVDKSFHWQMAVEAFSQYPPSKDLLLALGQSISQARKDLNTSLQEAHLLQAIDVSTKIGETVQRIHWIAILANFYLRQGQPDKAMMWLQQSVQLSIAHQHHLVTIAQGTILSGLWFGQGEINRVSALSLSIEEASIQRHNWIALATARNTRASCLLIRKQESEALQLLIETGDFLYSKGAVAALNLIKARLGEIHLLLGQERTRMLIQQFKQAN